MDTPCVLARPREDLPCHAQGVEGENSGCLYRAIASEACESDSEPSDGGGLPPADRLPRPAPGCPGLPPRRQGPKEAIKGEKKTRQGGRESGARCLPPRLVPTRALRQEGGFPTRTQRPSPIPHGPAMNPGQREHRRREVLDRRISAPLEESRRRAWWAETPVLVDAKPGGSPYVHCESTGKSGGSLRTHRNFPVFPLLSQSSMQLAKNHIRSSTPPSPSQAQRHRPPHGSNQGAKSRSRRTSRTSTGGPCLGARGKQAQLAQANGSKFNLLLMLVAQMSTYPRVIATHYCSWGSRKFKLTHGALTAFEDLGVVAVAVPRRARRCFSARLRRPPTRHRNRGRLLLQNLRSFDQSGI